VLAITLALVAVTAACGDDDESDDATEVQVSSTQDSSRATASPETSPEASVPEVDSSTDPSGEFEKTSLSVIVPAFSTFAHLQVAKDQGFWADRGLDVELVDFEGGAALAVENAIIRNEADLAYTTMATALILGGEGKYLEHIGHSSVYGVIDGTNTSGQTYVVREDSDINTVADLDGATVGMIARGGIEEALLTTMLDEQGIDASSVDMVASFWADHPALLDAGEIDVSMVVYPFALAYEDPAYCTIGNYSLGAPELGMPYIFGPDGVGGLPTITTEEFVGDNPNTMRAFLHGVDDAIAWVADNQEEFLQLAAEFGGTDVESLAKSPPMLFTNYRWVEERQVEWAQRMQAVLLDAGYLPAELDIDRMMTQPWDDALDDFAEPQAVMIGSEDTTFRPPPCSE
jgi:NitT/TauT family transport system substrate-binding protein